MGGGVLGYFGLIDWFYSLPKEKQEKIFQYSAIDSAHLVGGEVSSTFNTAAKLLASIAYNAFSSKDHSVVNELLQKSYELIKSKEDYQFCRGIGLRIAEEKNYIPDQKDIDRYKQKVLLKIKESPGILQADVKKLFPENDENLVGHALSQLKYEGKIRREKKGRSFQLYINPTPP